MAEEEKDQQADDKKADESEEKTSGGLVPLLVAAGVVVVCAGVGFGLSRVLSGPASAEATPQQEDESEAQADDAAIATGKFDYMQLDPITVTLDGPRMARYFRVTITLALERGDGKTADLIEERTPELKNWLNLYLAGQSLEGVRGQKNLNRLRREILDSMNEQLWPDGKPMIQKVLFEDVNVQ